MPKAKPTATLTELRRVFRPTDGGPDLPDPDPAASPERALELLALTDPALNNAVVEPAKTEGALLVYPVKINLGNKG